MKPDKLPELLPSEEPQIGKQSERNTIAVDETFPPNTKSHATHQFKVAKESKSASIDVNATFPPNTKLHATHPFKVEEESPSSSPKASSTKTTPIVEKGQGNQH